MPNACNSHKLSFSTIYTIVLFCATAVIASPAQRVVFTTLVNLDLSNGAFPDAGLMRGRDGNFYGTTELGGNLLNCGTEGCGTVFKLTPAGVLSTLYVFCSQPDCTDGMKPHGGLVQDVDGNFYGTTSAGGNLDRCTQGCGTVFKITPRGVLTTLHIFCAEPTCSDGAFPWSSLVQGRDGNLYGTTLSGDDRGTVFKITPEGTLTTLHIFDNGDGGAGPIAGLVQGSDENFYGTTTYGGLHGGGTVFRISSSGEFTMLHNFVGADGAAPQATLVQASDGNFYGTTTVGGNECVDPSGCGTIFKITPGGTLTTLYAFCSLVGCPDGSNPVAGLAQGSDSNFYGTAATGGMPSDICGGGCGTVFSITAEGVFTTLHIFVGTDGMLPYGTLARGSGASFYGTTYAGGTTGVGTYGVGTLFRLVEAVPCAVCRQ